MASTMGTARGRTQGSWRPLAWKVTGTPARVTVCCSRKMVATGLKATARRTVSPLEMPPWMPPLWLVIVWI
jgi:hypothetical protein